MTKERLEPEPSSLPEPLRAQRRTTRKFGRQVASWRGPKQGYWGFLLVVPILAFFIAFKFQPILRSVVLSFTDANPFNDKGKFTGLDNYLQLTRDPQFSHSIAVTAFYVVGSVIPIVVLSLGLALLLNERIRGIRVFRVMTFFPAIIPIIVVPILWQFLFHPYGLVNVGLETAGFGPVDWLRDKSAVIPGFILATDWRLVPLFSIVYLAGLQGIPEDLFDASKVDGATMVQRFRWVVLPMLRPTMLVVVIMATIFTAKSFTLTYVLTGGGPDNATLTLPLFIYKAAFQFFRVGYASAASMVLLAALVIITVINLRVFRSDD
jgi:multiple sugar transport system permease protein